ncbi:hypothetical protein [Paenibacillus sp. FSL L8-0506]
MITLECQPRNQFLESKDSEGMTEKEIQNYIFDFVIEDTAEKFRDNKGE